MSTLIDLATAKAYLMIGHTQQDTIVQILADGAESFLSTYLGSAFTSTVFAEDIDGGLATLLPTNRPVTALTIQAGQTYPTVVDRVTGDLIVVSLIGKGRIVRADPNTGVPWLQPNIYDLSMQQYRWAYWTRFMEGVRRYHADYTAGYAVGTAPPLLKQAALQLVYRAYHARGAEMNSGAKGASVGFGDFLSSDIAKMIQPFNLRSRVRT
jgi:hypothetical protein